MGHMYCPTMCLCILRVRLVHGWPTVRSICSRPIHIECLNSFPVHSIPLLLIASHALLLAASCFYFPRLHSPGTFLLLLVQILLLPFQLRLSHLYRCLVIASSLSRFSLHELILTRSGLVLHARYTGLVRRISFDILLPHLGDFVIEL